MAICPQHAEINLVPSPRALPGSVAHNKTSKPMSVIMPAMFLKRPNQPKLEKLRKLEQDSKSHRREKSNESERQREYFFKQEHFVNKDVR